jgi:hypothetical protein
MVAKVDAVLRRVQNMHFSEGLMVVLQLPRPGSDDLHALLARGRNKVDGFGDLWCWYVLMRHYIITMGRLEPKWLLPAFEGWELHNGPQVGDMKKRPEFARAAFVAVLKVVGPAAVDVFVVKSNSGWNCPGGNIDRKRDSNFEDAARREFAEEINPKGLDGLEQLVAGPVLPISVSLTLPMCPHKPNNSRPCVTFLLARAGPDFASLEREYAPHPAGGFRIPLPEFYARQDSCRAELQRRHQLGAPFIEGEPHCRWLRLDLDAGVIGDASVHPSKCSRYVRYLAQVLRKDSRPRKEKNLQSTFAQLLESG